MQGLDELDKDEWNLIFAVNLVEIHLKCMVYVCLLNKYVNHIQLVYHKMLFFRTHFRNGGGRKLKTSGVQKYVKGHS